MGHEFDLNDRTPRWLSQLRESRMTSLFSLKKVPIYTVHAIACVLLLGFKGIFEIAEFSAPDARVRILLLHLPYCPGTVLARGMQKAHGLFVHGLAEKLRVEPLNLDIVLRRPFGEHLLFTVNAQYAFVHVFLDAHSARPCLPGMPGCQKRCRHNAACTQKKAPCHCGATFFIRRQQWLIHDVSVLCQKRKAVHLQNRRVLWQMA